MKPVWQKNYPKNVPVSIDVPTDETLVSLFEKTCQQYANKTAFSCLGETLSYQQLSEYAHQFAVYLQQEVGIAKGDRVAIMLPNLLQYPVALFGILLTGGVVVNLNPLDKADNLKYELNDAGVKAIIVLEQFVAELEQVISETSVEQVILTSIGALFTPVKGWLVNFVLRHIKRDVPKWHLSGVVHFRQALRFDKDCMEADFNSHAISQKDLAFIQYTGGTTGRAKGVMLSHGNLINNLYQAQAWLMPAIKGIQNPVIITALPLYHIFSLMANCLLFMWVGGENVLIPDPRNLKNFINTLRNKTFHGITGVNTLFNALNHHQDISKINFDGLKISLGGGMSVQSDVAQKWQEISGCELTQAYGLTEASPAVAINVFSTDFDGFVGPPLPNTEIKIIDDKNNELGLNTPGELSIKGPQIMQGYWDNTEATNEVLSKDGWLKTGDIALVDERGFIQLIDRKKDTIIVSGFNVFPAEIEDVMMLLKDVKEVGVIGVPDATHGEVVKAFVVKEAWSTLTEGKIIDYCHQKMAAYKSPKIVTFVDALPKSQVGKVLRKELKLKR